MRELSKDNVRFSLEEIKSSIEEFLPSEIKVIENKNLIEQGIGSLQIMRLVNSYKKRGSGAKFSDLIKEPFLDVWFKKLNILRSSKNNTETCNEDIDRYSPFDLTPVQYSYWVGRHENQEMGGVGCHAYMELACGKDIDVDRLNEAYKKLQLHHPMLHTRFTPEGKQEEIKGYVSRDIEIVEVKGEDEFIKLRNKLSHRKLPVEKGECFNITLVKFLNGDIKLIYDVDLMVADVISFQKILTDLDKLYRGEELRNETSHFSFKDYLKKAEERDSLVIEEDEKYWKRCIGNIPDSPQLPLMVNPEKIRNVRFNSRFKNLSADTWGNIKDIASKNAITPAMVLLTVYGGVLERWSEIDRFNLNLPIFNRNTDESWMEDVISDFSNLLILDMDYSGKSSFLKRAKTVQDHFHERMGHSTYSGVNVVRDLKKVGKSSNIVFACNLGQPLLGERVIESFGNLDYMISQTPQVYIDCQTFDLEDGGILLKWDCVDELFPEGMLDDMFRTFVSYLEELGISEENWERDFIFIEAEEKFLAIPYEHYKKEDFIKGDLVTSFLENASRNPDAVAIVDGTNGDEFTYAQVRNLSLRLARKLINLGLKSGDMVAITMNKGPNQIIGVLGILMAGAAYVPVGVGQPLSRMESIYKRADIKFTLTSKNLIEKLDFPKGTHLIDIEQLEREDSELGDINIDYDIPRFNGYDTAYVIFTSGSTGEPKGVVISHDSIFNTIIDINNRYKVGNKDRTIAISALDFDLSVYDIFGPLTAGGGIVTIKDELSRDPESWKRIVEDYKVTIWNTVPALLDMLLTWSDANGGMKKNLLIRGMLSGDWIPLSLPEKFFNSFPKAQLISLGGATEASIWSNYYDIQLPLRKNWKSIPYGYPLTNQLFKIFDKKNRPCPRWVKGELIIEGAGVAKGYLNNPDQTGRAFFTDEGLAAYRTGDLGRFREDGLMEFMGRKDFQIKVRGHRIEAGEIECALNSLGIVEKELVTTIKDEANVNHLIAYIVPKDKNFDFNSDEEKLNLRNKLEKELGKKLPSYMVPALYIFLSSMPVTANGKIDRKALEAIKVDLAHKIEISEDFESDTEKTLAGILRDLLKIDFISRNSDYFALGGDSLIAVHLVNKIKEIFKVDFSLGKLFEGPIVSTMATNIDLAKRNITDYLVKENRNSVKSDEKKRYDPFSLSEVQRAYWLGRQGLFGEAEITTHYYFEIERDELNLEFLEKAINSVVDYQDMLHASILNDGKNQKILKTYPEYILKNYDCSNLPEDEKLLFIENIREEMAHKRFDESDFFPMDVRVIKERADRFRINLCFDNIIFDGFSVFLFFSQVSKAYFEILDKGYCDFNPLDISFRDFMVYMEDLKSGKDYENAKKYWSERVDSIPPAPGLAFEPVNGNKLNFIHLEKEVPKDKWDRLKNRIKNIGGVTPAAFLMSAFTELLNRWSSQSHFALNLTRFNRPKIHEDINNVIGDFTSLSILETDFSKGETFAERAKVLASQLMKDLDNSAYDGALFQRDVALKRNVKGAIYPVVFTSALGLDNGGNKNLFSKRIYSCSETSQVLLDHQASEEDGNLILVWDLVKEAFPDGMYENMFESFEKLIDRLVEDEECIYTKTKSLVQINLPIEVVKANETRKKFEKISLYDALERAVKTHPERIALLSDDTELTYKNLVKEAFPIYKRLMDHGVKVGEPIGVLSKKSIDQIKLVTGIVLTGAAYVPLDTSYPIGRVSDIAIEANIKTIVTDKESLKELEFTMDDLDINWLVLEECESFKEVSIEECFSLNNIPQAKDLAYIIYTSGSTGKPKGVAISHGSAMNTILDINEKFNLGPEDRSFAISSLNFDLSVYDIFGMFACAGSIYMVPASRTRDPQYWKWALENKGITIWNSVPAFMKMLVEAGKLDEGFNYQLRLIMMSGDWIPIDLPKKISKVFTNADIYSLGGATECSIWSNFYKIDPSINYEKSIPYGKPLSNQEFRILDKNFNKRPVYVQGDLYITGEGLALGYYNNPEKTEEAFVDNLGFRMYKTGDQGRYLPDGNIEFLGRNDFQVKVNGYRIELGEIEEVIKKVDGVKDAVVLVADNNKLHAFITPDILGENKKNIEVPTEEFLSKSLDSLIKQGKEEDNRSFNDFINDFYKGLNSESVRFIKEILKDLDRSRIDERFLGLVDIWEGIVEESEISLDEPESLMAPELLHSLEDVYKTFSDSEYEIKQILYGEMEARELFTSGKSSITPLKMSKLNPTRDFSYINILEQIKNMAGDRLKKLKIAELGTRSGNLLEFLDKNLVDSISIDWLDNSSYFLNQIKPELKNINANLVDFNMNEEPEEQGIKLYSYDFIIADNTIHRAQDIGKTLASLEKLLKPEGMLIFIEQNENNAFVVNVAGISEEGFKNIKDERELPLLSNEKWKEKLSEIMEYKSLIGDYLSSLIRTSIFTAWSRDLRLIPSSEELIKTMGKSLPSYMIPEAVTLLESLPYTANGKVDRKRLSYLGVKNTGVEQKTYIPPEGKWEESIAAAFEEVLGLERVSADEEFFLLGGDSLTAISLMNILKEKYGLWVKLQDIFGLQTVRNLAKICEADEAGDDELEIGEI